jgi:hypothetical protein
VNTKRIHSRKTALITGQFFTLFRNGLFPLDYSPFTWLKVNMEDAGHSLDWLIFFGLPEPLFYV